MTTAHHPVSTGATSHHVRMWLELAVVVVLAVFTALAIVWAVNRGDDTTTSVSDQTSGFEYSAEATGGRLASPGVTAPFVGESGDLYPEVPTAGFEHNVDATSGHIASPGVTAPFVGSSG